MTLKINKLLCAATIPLTLFFSVQPSFAQSENNIYEPDFFTQYASRSALDMIEQIPGFQLQGADNRRGLGQGGANILINGERLTGKTDVVSQLSRIVSENAVRIEIKDGASLDIPGLSGQVANVFTKSTGRTGTWSWAPEFRKRQNFNLGHAHLTVSGETGNLVISMHNNS